MQAYGKSDIGQTRTENQDSIFLDDALGLWIVADGMGGYQGGAEAAQQATSLLPALIEQEDTVAEALFKLHEALCDLSLQSDHPRGFGTTLALVRQQPERLNVYWVGDCRVYSITRHKENNAEIQRLSKDHSHVASMVELGLLTEEEARQHPKRHIVTQCLGAGKSQKPQIGYTSLHWTEDHADSAILICSDGLYGELTDQDILTTVEQSTNTQQAVDKLIASANSAGGRDNTSVIMISNPAFWQPRQLSLSTTRKLQAYLGRLISFTRAC